MISIEGAGSNWMSKTFAPYRRRHSRTTSFAFLSLANTVLLSCRKAQLRFTVPSRQTSCVQALLSSLELSHTVLTQWSSDNTSKPVLTTSGGSFRFNVYAMYNYCMYIRDFHNFILACWRWQTLAYALYSSSPKLIVIPPAVKKYSHGKGTNPDLALLHEVLVHPLHCIFTMHVQPGSFATVQ